MTAITISPAAPRAILPKPTPQGSSAKAIISNLPKDLVEYIFSLASDLRAAATSRNFHQATNALIRREWSRFDLKLYPIIRSVFLGNPPTNCGELGTIVDMMQGKCHIQSMRSHYAAGALATIDRSFSPVRFKALEDAAKQAESDRNLQLIWPRIARTLNIQPGQMNIEEIKEYLKTHPNELANIEHLNLSRLNLSVIPEEFATLALPSVTSINLEGNQLKTLPNNFGKNWNQLQRLVLDYNQLTALPENFGSSWNQLQTLGLHKNQLNALPNNFGSNWNLLSKLYLDNNQLKALPNNFGSNWSQLHSLWLQNNQLNALPNNFGNNWNQLRFLRLYNNQLNALPNNFGANWHWWTEKRNTALNKNPILNPAHLAQRPQTTSHRLQKALTSARAVHAFSTSAIAGISTYVLGWKSTLALGAIYLTHRYYRGKV